MQTPSQGPEITIKMRPDGQGVIVTAPVQMPALCYGMLQMAHDCIQEALAEQRKGGTGLQIAQDGDIPPVPAPRRGK